MLHHLQPLPRPGERHPQDLADTSLRSVGHHHHAVGQQQGLIDVVGHHHGGDASFLADAHQLLLQIAARQRIEGAEGLIEQQQPRADRQGAGDRHPLLHAARELRGKFLGGGRQPHHRQVALHDLVPLGRAELAHHPVHRQRHVLAHGLPGQQRIVLKHHHPVGPRLGHLPPIDQDAAMAGLRQARQQVQQGALAAAGMADQRDEFALADLQVDVLEGHIAAAIVQRKDLRDVVDGEEGDHLSWTPVPRADPPRPPGDRGPGPPGPRRRLPG